MSLISLIHLTHVTPCCRRGSQWRAPPEYTPGPGSRAATPSWSASRVTQTGEPRAGGWAGRVAECTQNQLINRKCGFADKNYWPIIWPERTATLRLQIKEGLDSDKIEGGVYCFGLIACWPVQTFIDSITWAISKYKNSLQQDFLCLEPRTVNSYHQWGLQQENSRLEG